MFKLHHLENSQSFRVLWLLEELGAEYEVVHYARDPKTSLAPASYKALHPAGTSPCLEHNGAFLAETNAIVDYILDLHPGSALRPPVASVQRRDYLYWLHATQGTLMPLLLESLLFKRMVSKVPFFLRPVVRLVVGKVRSAYLYPRLRSVLGAANVALGSRAWLSGERITAADIVMGYCLEVAEVRTSNFGAYPHLGRFLNHMRARPAYQRALTRGGAFQPLSE